MKLRKDKWEEVKFDKFVFNISERVDPKKTALDKYIGLEHLDSGKTKIDRYGKPDEVIGTKLKIYKGDIIFAKRRAYQRKAAVADFDAICSAHSMVLRPNEQNIDKNYLLQFMHSDLFMNRAVEISEGSLSPTIKWKILATQQFPLPPLKEQKQIAALFQFIDNAIEQTEAQEKNLTSLRTKLASGLVSPNPNFGNLLNSDNCNSCILGDIARESRKNTKSPLDDLIERFVGLEHIEPGNLKIQKWGNVADGTTFTKTFKIGDVLFGRRRAYLKKAACADFNGLCSGDITVLRATPKLILPELLQYYFSADPVFEYAVSNSAGSLSPRVKWRDLSKYELAIPALQIQKEILKVFQLIDLNLHQNKKQKTSLQNLKQNLLNEILG